MRFEKWLLTVKIPEWIKLLDQDGENTKEKVQLEMIKLLAELED